MIGESMDLSTQALALGYLSLSWGFGTILGQQPLLGSCCLTQCMAAAEASLLHGLRVQCQEVFHT